MDGRDGLDGAPHAGEGGEHRVAGPCAVRRREGDAELVPIGRLIGQLPAGLRDDEVVLSAALVLVRAAVRGGAERLAQDPQPFGVGEGPFIELEIDVVAVDGRVEPGGRDPGRRAGVPR